MSPGTPNSPRPTTFMPPCLPACLPLDAENRRSTSRGPPVRRSIWRDPSTAVPVYLPLSKRRPSYPHMSRSRATIPRYGAASGPKAATRADQRAESAGTKGNENCGAVERYDTTPILCVCVCLCFHACRLLSSAPHLVDLLPNPHNRGWDSFPCLYCPKKKKKIQPCPCPAVCMTKKASQHEGPEYFQVSNSGGDRQKRSCFKL